MTVFEYIFIFISIILALAVGQLAKGLGRIMRPGSDFRPDALYFMWLVFLFMTMVEFWWGSWYWREIESWSALALMGPILSVMVLYLMADITVSVDQKDSDTSVYMSISSRVWFLAALYMALAWLAWRFAELREYTLDSRGLLQIFFILMAILLALAKNKWIHRIGMTSWLVGASYEFLARAPIS